MSLHPRNLRVALGIVGFLAVNTTVEAAVVSLKAVKKNNVAITPTNNLAVRGGDTIEAEIFLSGWGNELPLGVRGYLVTLAGRVGFTSGDNGTILPLGWCAPVDKINCTTSADCPAAYPTCLTSPPTGCTCSPHNPFLGWFITRTRTNYLLFGLDEYLPDLTTPSNLDYKYFGLAKDPAQAVTDTGVPRYLGTLIVKVSQNACGTFTIGFIQDITSTFIADPANPPNRVLPTSQPLTLVVTDCARQLLSCSPAHCNVDARRAMDPKTGARLNPNAIDMTFSKTTAGMTSADFEMTVLPIVEGDTIPTIQSVTQYPVDPNKTRIVILPRIAQTRWTCFRDIGSNKRCCLGSLPGDSDTNRISNANDIFESLDNLLGSVNPILTMEKCDTDRSLLCSSADLLMIVDLLNGADLFDPPTLNQTLPVLVPDCPDMRLPP